MDIDRVLLQRSEAQFKLYTSLSLSIQSVLNTRDRSYLEVEILHPLLRGQVQKTEWSSCFLIRGAQKSWRRVT